MEYICTHPHKKILYHVHRNSEGYLELYRKFDDPKKDVERIVTNVRDTSELAAYLNPPKKKRKRYDPYKDNKQMRIE